MDAATASNSAATIHFAGALPEAQTLARIAAADMLVLPSLMEGLPVVLMEAMAIGVPVVASRVAGIPELVEHGTTGLTFTPTDAAALADAIMRVVNDRESMERMVAAGRQRVIDMHAIEQSAAQMQGLFHMLDC